MLSLEDGEDGEKIVTICYFYGVKIHFLAGFVLRQITF